MITYVNKELLVTTEDWNWKLKLSTRITSVSKKDCGKTFLYDVIRTSDSEDVIAASKEDIICGFDKVVKNKLIVIDDCTTVAAEVGEGLFDAFVNNMLFDNNDFLLLDWDGVGIYIAEGRIIEFTDDFETRVTTGGY